MLLVRTLLATAAGACKSSNLAVSSNASTAQAMLDIGQHMVQLWQEDALLQVQIDTHHGVVAYPDTILRQRAVSSGLFNRPRSASMP